MLDLEKARFKCVAKLFKSTVIAKYVSHLTKNAMKYSTLGVDHHNIMIGSIDLIYIYLRSEGEIKGIVNV